MNQLDRLEEKINIFFNNKTLLQTVFVHRSYLNENKKSNLSSNEKLEFLGDSVLSLISSVYLFKNYPNLKEGEYTEIKSSIVKTDSLAQAAKELQLGSYLLLSKGEEKSGGRENKNILADCFEALIAAIFIDKDFETVYNFVIKHLFEKKLDHLIKNRLYMSAKSRLQELIQAKFKTLPTYKVLEEKGPEHKRLFKVGVFFKEKQLGFGYAYSKKAAEEKAAKVAFENIEKKLYNL